MANRWQRVLAIALLLVFCNFLYYRFSPGYANDGTAVDLKSTMTSTSITSFAPQFTVPASADGGANLIPNIYDPYAVNAQEVCSGYVATDIKFQDTSSFSAQLSLKGESCNVYGNDVTDLDLLVEYQAESRLHISIQPSRITHHNESWFTLPEAWVPAPQSEGTGVESADLAFSWTNSPSFGFNVTRKSTQDVLFSTTGTQLIYEDQFIEFVTLMDEGYNLYGLGEVIHGIRLEPGLTRTLYGSDAGDNIDRNIYGSHPFYLETKYYEVDEDTGLRTLVTDGQYNESAQHTSSSHGVYLRNAHGMEVLMNPKNVTWRTLGGNIDLYFFSGPSQPEVTSQYLSQVGLPVLQQYWTFGYHQCRWGYDNWTTTEEVVDNFAKFEIPLETIWNDIDYMKAYRDFENDPIRFSYDDGQAFLGRLHERGQYYVPIVDAAIYVPNPENASDAYPIFDDGNEAGSFLLNPDGSLYIGAVWPGYTGFPDWLSNPSASDWWRRSVVEYYKNLPFDGIWIDMNEASSFCVGSCGSGNLSLNPVHPSFLLPGEPGNKIYDYPEGFETTNKTEAASAAAASATQAAAQKPLIPSSTSSTSYLRTTPTPGVRNINHPPYVMNHIHGDLASHAISPNATHHNGVQEYDVHNIYGHTLLQNTYAAIAAAKPGLRPFIIGRSTFVGSGNYSGHWGGDNYSKFALMYFSIPQALSFSLFGIPMFGPDTCGFAGDTSEELCNRWMQLSAFFPFYRNHNVLSAIDQEPYIWESVMDATKSVMNIRFQLLPYMYTLFYHAHTRGDTVMRALAWEFPNDPSLASADRQFMLGPAILVIPVLTQGHKTVDGVFPGLVEGTEIYYDWYNQRIVPTPAKKNTTIDAPLGHIPVYIRGGHILATQQMRMTTRDARKTDWSLIVAIGKNGYANTTLYLDDGVSLEPAATKLVTIDAQVGQQQVHPQGKDATRIRVDAFVNGEYDGLDLPLSSVTVLGVTAAPANQEVMIDDEIVSDAHVEYSAEKQRLVISNLQAALGGKVWGRNWSLTM